VTSTGIDYMMEVKDQFEIYGSLSKITGNLQDIERETNTFITQYDKFSFLWKEDLEESFKAFIESGEYPGGMKKKKENVDGEDNDGGDDNEIDEKFTWMSKKILTGVQIKKPTLDKFDEKITYLQGIKQLIEGLKLSSDLGWLRVNSAPLKSGI
jgi:hypothetical protein